MTLDDKQGYILDDINGYSLREFNPTIDKQHLVSLWQRNLSKVPVKRFSWLYDKSDTHEITTWLLSYKGIVCGSISVLVHNFVDFTQENVSVGFCCDFMVDKEHRTLLPALKLLRFAVAGAQKRGVDYLLGLPNKNASAVFTRAGFDYHLPVNRWVNLIDCYEKLNFSNSVYGHFLQRTISWTVNFCKKYSINFYFLGAKKKFSSQETTFSSWLPSSENDNNNGFGFNLKHFILWRYRDNPVHDYQLFSVKYKSQEVAIFYSIEQEEVIISKIVSSDTKTVGLALNQFTNYLRNKGVKSISLLFAGQQEFVIGLRKSGFVKRPTTANLLVIDLKKRGMTFFDRANFFEGDMDL